MTTTAAQEAFLRAFHAQRPAVTAEAFGASRAPDGRTSYELLGARVAGRDRVLDLGCGDGLLLEVLARDAGRRLAGVDLSSRALSRAWLVAVQPGAGARESDRLTRLTSPPPLPEGSGPESLSRRPPPTGPYSPPRTHSPVRPCPRPRHTVTPASVGP